MKHSKNQDKSVLNRLKELKKAEESYNNQFVEARKDVREREKSKLTGYEKFKRTQEKERKANEMLEEFLKQS